LCAFADVLVLALGSQASQNHDIKKQLQLEANERGGKTNPRRQQSNPGEKKWSANGGIFLR
jgi:hypothetical protein